MTDSSDKKRAPTSSDDRALAGLERRRAATPPRGVPVGEFDHQPTPPPSDVEDLISKLWPLRHVEGMITDLATRTSVLEHRASHLADLAGGLDEIGQTRLEMREGFADLRGERGDNGKLGELRRRVDSLSGKAWWLFTAFVGALGTAMIKVVMVTRAFDAVEHTAARSADEIKILQAQILTLQTALIVRRHRPEGTP